MITTSREKFTDSDLEDLEKAKSLLESTSLPVRLASALGESATWTVGKLGEGVWAAGKLPYLPQNLSDKAQEKIQKATQAALVTALNLAIGTLGDAKEGKTKDVLHKFLTTTSGVATGLAGFYTSLADLPISTTIILRWIADIAQSEGHDLTRPETRLECLQVFALSGKGSHDDANQSAYWATRASIAGSLSNAAKTIAEKGLTSEQSTSRLVRYLAKPATGQIPFFFYRAVNYGPAYNPVLARFIEKIQLRYSQLVTQQTVAKAIPFAGAVSGGAINLAFMNHFQDMARGHFIVKRLEAKYGTERVQEQYAECEIE